jgi:hypothetical protein
MFFAIGVLLVLLGWPLAARRVRPNRWYGLRVRATVTDERVWYDANAVSGRDMMALGVAVAAIAAALPRVIPLPEVVYTAVCAGLLAVGTLVLVVRGWLLANRMRDERRGTPGR